MYSARCFRTLDKPILVFGLEIEDLLAVVLVGGLGLFVVGPWIALPAGLLLYGALLKFKSGRPAGYVYERLYRYGIVFAVRLLAVPHLVKLQRRYSAFSGELDEGHPIERFYWDKP